jgi:hypothetical protein
LETLSRSPKPFRHAVASRFSQVVVAVVGVGEAVAVAGAGDEAAVAVAVAVATDSVVIVEHYIYKFMSFFHLKEPFECSKIDIFVISFGFQSLFSLDRENNECGRRR